MRIKMFEGFSFLLVLVVLAGWAEGQLACRL